MSDLVKRLRASWARIEPGTDDVALMVQISAQLAEAASVIERLEGEHENIARGRIPTHRCKVCDTFWRELPDAYTMIGIWCGEVCCVGANVEPLPVLPAALSRTKEQPSKFDDYDGNGRERHNV